MTDQSQKEEQPSTNESINNVSQPKESANAWWTVLGGFLVFFVIWGLPISFGAFQDFYTLDYLSDYQASTISWIGTVQGALLVLVGLLSGPLYDLGYWRHLYACGSFLTVFGMMMLSISTNYYQVFLAQGICVGFGCGLLYIPTLSLVGAAFSGGKRALAMGVITSGIALGGIIFTVIYLKTLPTLGFGWMVRIIAFVSLAAFVAGAPTLRLRQQKNDHSARKLFDKAALADVPFLVFTLVQFFVFLGYLVPLFYIPTFAKVALQANESTALYILIGSQAGSLFGRLGATYLVRFIGVMIPWVACCCISGILCFTWIVSTELGSFVAFSSTLR